MNTKSRFIEWEPGNCTRYGCVLATVEDKQGEPCVLLSWLKNGDAGGPSILVRPWNTVSLGYLMEKMGVNEADGAALLALLKQKCGVEVYMPEGYDENGCRKAPLVIAVPTLTTQLYAKLEAAGVDDGDLDELVHDVLSRRASAVNNGGLPEQVEFLLSDGYTTQAIEEYLKK